MLLHSATAVNSVTQLIGILETTIDAFSELDENVSVTNESSGIINTSIAEISKLVDSINDTLKKTQSGDHAEQSENTAQ